MTVYELSKTPATPAGLFLRNRSNAISVRSQRRSANNRGKVLDQNENEVYEPQRRKSRFSNEFDTSVQQSKSEEILSKSYSRRERAYSNDWDGEYKSRHRSSSKHWNPEDDADFDPDEDLPPPRPVSRRDFERKSEVFSRSRSRMGYRSNGPMETLDRRISASTDNLDTLKREKRSNRHWNNHQPMVDPHQNQRDFRPRSQSRAQSKVNLETEDDVTFRINGEKMSKNKYFFGSELKSALKPTKSTRKVNEKTASNNPAAASSSSKNEAKNRKTALDIFLEDKGPYSRKLYGPPPQVENGDKSQRKRTRSQEAILQMPTSSPAEDEASFKKGLLWQQRDKLFSRWKERYFILTKDYFHCFKKAGTSRITEMGGFIFKLKLTEVDSIELLDKRGYLTVCITLFKDGKIYLRRPEGIREWFMALQANIYECKRRRKFWVKRQVTDSANIEQWLLARQKIGMQYPGSSPDILETTESKEPQVPAPEKELGPTPNGGNGGGGGGPPRAVSRSAMVKAVVEQEEEEKPVKNVCLVDTPQIFPATTSMTTRAVIESAASSSAEYVAPNHPKGINRMSLVNELILKEKSDIHHHRSNSNHDLVILEDQSHGSAMSSSSSVLAESSAGGKSSSASRSSMQSSNSSSNNVNKLEDSSNDSGHNSMNTNSSDSQSDGTNSGSEEKPVEKSSIKITNNGHAMKIMVEGGNFNNGTSSGSKSVDADVLLNTEKAKPALLPRPPPSLTTPSILKFRGKHLQSA